MKNDSSWQYDEFKQVGKDYGDSAEVEAYDASHGDFRDIQTEACTVLDLLALEPDATLVDFGCGTGTFAIEAARRCKKVYAVDVSATMLDYAREKAARAGINNIEFHHGGFLSYAHPGPAVDAISTIFAFHHLPDFWKGVALGRLYEMLKPAGQFYLHDAIIEPDNCLGNLTNFIDKLAAAGGSFMREDAEMHFREEFSTYDWIIDGLLIRARFKICQKTLEDGVLATYLCIRPGRFP